MKLNLGCGATILEGYINVDKYHPVADVKADILQLPFPDCSADEVILSHVIEHISWRKHYDLLEEIHRVLRNKGLLELAYPEFEKCVEAFLTNKDGRRWRWWVKALYGSQEREGLYHVAPILTDRLIEQLTEVGFTDFEIKKEGCDTALRCKKTEPLPWF